MARTAKIKIIENIAVVYARYSSHNQKDLSIEQQIDAARKYAGELDVVIVDTYEDRAVSGRTDKRPSFQRMMKDAEKGRFQYVIAWKSNRMGRNMLEALLNEAKLQDLGVKVLYIEEDFDDTAAGRFALRSMMNVNQFYSESMAEDIKRGMDDNAKKCMVNGSVGYGHKKGEDGRFAIQEEQAAILLEIYTRVADYEPHVDIYTDLNNRGIPSPSGGEWNRSSFQRLLPPNERVIGVYVWGKHRVPDGVPRLISDALYYTVAEVLKTKKNARGRHRNSGDYLLTGKLFCGHCKSPMTGISGTSHTKDIHYYYTCKKRRTHECDKKNVIKDEIELAVAKIIKDVALQMDVIEWIADSTIEYYKKKEQSSMLALFEEELSANQKAIKNLMTAIEQGIITDTTKSRLLELEKEQVKIKANIEREKRDIPTVSREDIVLWMSSLRKGKVTDKKYQATLFNTFLIAAYVYDGNLKLVLSFTGENKVITVPFDLSASEDIENIQGDGVRLSSSKLHHLCTAVLIPRPCFYFALN